MSTVCTVSQRMYLHVVLHLFLTPILGAILYAYPTVTQLAENACGLKTVAILMQPYERGTG